MKKAMICIMFFLVSLWAFAEGERLALNARQRMKSIPAFVAVPAVTDRSLTIVKLDQKMSGNKITTILTLDKPLPVKSRVVLYYDFNFEFIIFIYNAKIHFTGASGSRSLKISGSQAPGDAGYRILPGNKIQCVTLKNDSPGAGLPSDYDLNWKKGTLYAFLLDGDDVGEFLPAEAGGLNPSADALQAISNVSKLDVSYMK